MFVFVLIFQISLVLILNVFKLHFSFFEISVFFSNLTVNPAVVGHCKDVIRFCCFYIVTDNTVDNLRQVFLALFSLSS